MVCDLTIAADNAIFGQTGPKVPVPFFFRYSLLVLLLSSTSGPQERLNQDYSG